MAQFKTETQVQGQAVVVVRFPSDTAELPRGTGEPPCEQLDVGNWEGSMERY